MKAADLKVGDLLYRQRSRYTLGEKVRVVDAEPRWEKIRWQKEPSRSHKRTNNVLVDIFDYSGKTIRLERQVVPLRSLIGPYDETVKRLKAEERAAEKARNERTRQENEARDYTDRVVAVARKRGVNAWNNNRYGTAQVIISTKALEALLVAVPAGWKMPTEDEEV